MRNYTANHFDCTFVICIIYLVLVIIVIIIIFVDIIILVLQSLVDLRHSHSCPPLFSVLLRKSPVRHAHRL